MTLEDRLHDLLGRFSHLRLCMFAGNHKRRRSGRLLDAGLEMEEDSTELDREVVWRMKRTTTARSLGNMIKGSETTKMVER